MSSLKPQRHSSNQNTLRNSKNVDQHNFMANYFNLPIIIPKPSQRIRTLSLNSDTLRQNSEGSSETQVKPLKLFRGLKDKQEEINIKQEDIRLPIQPKILQQALPKEGKIESPVKGLKNYEIQIQKFRSKNPQPDKFQIYQFQENQEAQFNFSSPKNKHIKIKNHRAKTISFEDIFSYHNLNQQQKIKKKTKKELKRKLKIVLLFIRAAMRLSKLYRKVIKLFDQYFQYVNKFRQLDLRVQHNKFAATVANKILLFIKTKQYYTECQSVWYEDENQIIQDIRRTRYCGFSMMFLQNLEFLTRAENLPVLITNEINLSLFNSRNNLISQFVFNRCNFYRKKITELTTNEKLLITVEAFLFEILIPSLVDLGNGLDNSDLAFINQTQHYLIGIISVLQLLFTYYFSSMTLIKQQKLLKRQKILKVNTNKENGHWKLLIETATTQEKDDTEIISGCYPKDVLEEICSQKQHWNQKLQKLFQQVVSNLQKQIKL